AASKRGAHLAVTLERLDALLERPAQRIRLSATVRPIEEVARFLGGQAPVTIVQPPAAKTFDLRVVVPVEDMTELGVRSTVPVTPGPGEPEETGLQSAGSIWPHVYAAIVEQVLEHRSTIVFANSRRLAERLTASMNELYAELVTGEASEKFPAAMVGASGLTRQPTASTTVGAGGARGPEMAPAASAPALARAHHGSV